MAIHSSSFSTSYNSIYSTRRFLLVVISLSFLLTCCVNSGKQSIDASLDVPVTDDNLRRITDVTSQATIEANGKFKAGTFFFKNTPVLIPENTNFQLQLKLPVDNPAVISTKKATGSLVTSNQITFGAVPVPQDLKFQSGKVEAYVDFVRGLSALMLNIVQLGGNVGGMKDMIDSMEINELELKLRPGSKFVLGEKSLNIGKDSWVKLYEAKLDKDFNYKGLFTINSNFTENCKWLGKKLDCQFNGGSALLSLKAEKVKDRLILKLPEESKEKKEIKLNDCLLNFGKNKRCSTRSKNGTIFLKQFHWEDTKDGHPSMEMESTMDLHDTDATIVTDIHSTKAHFPGEVPGDLTVKIDKQENVDTHFKTTGPAMAKDGVVTISKKNSKVVLKLADVTVGKVSYDKTGAMEFNLKGGKSEIKEVIWEAKGKRFALLCSPGSTLAVPSEFLIEKPTKTSAARVEMPMTLNLGSAELKKGDHTVKLANFKGDLVLDVHEEVLVKGNLDFTLPDLDLLSNYKARVKAKGLDMSVANGKSTIYLRDCTLLIPDNTLSKTLQEKIPSTYHIKLNKKVQEEKKWRYRNAIVKEVDIKDFKIDKMSFQEQDKIFFVAEADATSNGTIEKAGIIIHKNKWETCPWSMHGAIQGKGEVRYKFLKRSNNKNARLAYDLDMKVELPESVELDWSKVSGGLIKIAEKRAIVNKLRKISVPVAHRDEITIFRKDAPIWKNFAVSDLRVKDLPDATQIDFQVQTKM